MHTRNVYIHMYVHLQVWKEAFGSKQSLPYMEHELAGSANSVQFCPYEDVLGIGHEYGFSSIVVPGVLLTCYDVSIVLCNFDEAEY